MSQEREKSIHFYLYQLKDDNEKSRRLMFMNSSYLKKVGMSVKGNNYKFVYGGEMTSKSSASETLESIYERFNLHHPDDFRGHSLSVSDVVVLREDGRDQAYFVDSFGFTQVPEFFADNPLEKVEELMEDDYGMIDGYINNGNRREEKEEKTVRSVKDKLMEKKEEAHLQNQRNSDLIRPEKEKIPERELG